MTWHFLVTLSKSHIIVLVILVRLNLEVVTMTRSVNQWQGRVHGDS